MFGIVYVRLGDVATITRGGNFQKKDFVEQGFPCIHYGQIYTSFGIYTDKTIKNVSEDAAKKSKKAVKNDIVMAVTSENIDDICKCVAWLGDDEIAVSGHTAIIHHDQNPKFLAYYFYTEDFFKQKKKLAHGTKVIEVSPDKLNDIIIPLPSIEEQERIVSVLDHFDTLCNDLSDRLSAEIEARQKQYEYYRDKLLTFKELSE
ncbi:MAG: restriction endonuclease subunit S [Lachnospiraceae bacterium]|nr:restriction endonuclease subunit S [Lachnospiraceae bacterium]